MRRRKTDRQRCRKTDRQRDAERLGDRETETGKEEVRKHNIIYTVEYEPQDERTVVNFTHHRLKLQVNNCERGTVSPWWLHKYDKQ